MDGTDENAEFVAAETDRHIGRDHPRLRTPRGLRPAVQRLGPVLAVVAAVAAGGAGMALGDPSLVGAGSSDAAASPCPRTASDEIPPVATRPGSDLRMVPDAPVAAEVCDYHADLPTNAPLTSRTGVMALVGHRSVGGAAMGRIIDALNATSGTALAICFGVYVPGAVTEARVVFRYSSGADVSVDVVLQGCGVVENGAKGGAVESGYDAIVAAITAVRA